MTGLNDTELSDVKVMVDKQAFEMHGRVYSFGKFTYKTGMRIFGFASDHSDELDNNKFGCLTTPEFEKIENLILENVLFDGMQVSKLVEHWEKYKGDYLPFILSALAIISYPFTAGAA